VLHQILTDQLSRPDDTNRTPVATAIAEFIAYTKDGGSKDSTLSKYQTLMDQLQAFADWKGYRYIQEFDQDAVKEFRNSWEDAKAGYKRLHLNSKGFQTWSKVSVETAKRQAKTLRYLFDLCIIRKWMTENPTTVLRFPKAPNKGRKKKEDVKYLTPNQMTDVLWAVDKLERMPPENKARLKALILTMRWTGLRISDAVVLTDRKIVGDVLYVETKKSSTDVQIPLPPELMDAIKLLEIYDGGFLFWNRRSEGSDSQTPLHNFSALIAKVMKKAGVRLAGKLAHRFRNTFAVGLIEKGVPLETVSLMLGHQSVTTTERYYGDFTKGYMDRAEELVRFSWTLKDGEKIRLAKETTSKLA
jgi:site-specific recombinase XerD